MKSIMLAAISLTISSMHTTADDVEVVVADSGSPKVDQLVRALVSRVAAPIPNGGKIPGGGLGGLHLLNSSGRHATADVL